MVRLMAPLAVLMLCAACAGSPANGSRFDGDGFSIEVPSNPGFTYSHSADNVAAHDFWVVEKQPAEGIAIEVSEKVLNGQLSLEGSLARAEQLLALMDASEPDVRIVDLPAGRAYQVDAVSSFGSHRIYAFFKDGTEYLVTFQEVPTALSDQIRSFTID